MAADIAIVADNDPGSKGQSLQLLRAMIAIVRMRRRVRLMRMRMRMRMMMRGGDIDTIPSPPLLDTLSIDDPSTTKSTTESTTESTTPVSTQVSRKITETVKRSSFSA